MRRHFRSFYFCIYKQYCSFYNQSVKGLIHFQNGENQAFPVSFRSWSFGNIELLFTMNKLQSLCNTSTVKIRIILCEMSSVQEGQKTLMVSKGRPYFFRNAGKFPKLFWTISDNILDFCRRPKIKFPDLLFGEIPTGRKCCPT